MFAGIIQNRGTVVKLQKSGSQIRLGFRLQRNERKLKLGESIAVNGVCLTAAKVEPQYFESDVIDATLRTTNLGNLRLGDSVNIERSLKYGDSFSGHFVTGHVDCRAHIKKIQKQGRNRIIEIESSKAIRPFLAVKGSVALDGVSLTIQEVKRNTFKAALVPYTLRETTLGRKKVGDFVNLEVDIIARYTKMIIDSFPQKRGYKQKDDKTLLAQLKKQGF